MTNKLELYLIKFDKTNEIILKIYSLDCKVRRDKYQHIIVITHDKYIFLSNDYSRFI